MGDNSSLEHYFLFFPPQDLDKERQLREQLQKQLSDLENLRAMTRNKLQEIEEVKTGIIRCG